MLKEDSMLYFEDLFAFRRFYSDFNIYGTWRITGEDINSRGERVRHAPYIERLREIFNGKKLFRKSVSIAELVSFVDGYYIFDKIVRELRNELAPSTFEKISLISEYRIKLSKNRRIDFILIYEKKLLLIEFRISNTFPNVSNVWQRKETELLIYKELLGNYINSHYRIHIYAFIGMPEYVGKDPISKQIKYNNDNIRYFVEYIKEFIIKSPKEESV